MPAPPTREIPLYSLIVSGTADRWDHPPRAAMPRDRFGEHTAEALRARYARLGETNRTGLKSFPALLAYEVGHGKDARVARITRFLEPSPDEIRFEYQLVDAIAPIPAARIADLAWDLDVGRLEMYRTHWAVKDVDLLEVLREAGIAGAEDPDAWARTAAGAPAAAPSSAGGVRESSPPYVGAEPPGLRVTPSVFAVPADAPDPRLVAVMMPFAGFDRVYAAIRQAVERADLRCERADDVWEASTIMQDVFSLIYRSAVTVVDLTGRNSNVMYETGIAHTLGRPVVPIAQDVGQLPFDLAHHRTLGYTADADGLAAMQVKLERRLRALTRPAGTPRA